MSSPKHLWSGDWERESAASAPVESPAPPAAEPADPGPPEPSPWRPRRGVLAVAVVLVAAIVGVAIASAVGGGGNRPSVTITGETTPTAVTPFGFGQTGPGQTAPGTGTGTSTGPTATAPTGTATSPAPPPGASTLGLVLQSLPGNRVSVQAVVPGSPAAQAGIGAGDVLLSVNGRAVSSASQVQALLARLPKGSPVTMHLIQGSSSLTVQIQLSGSP
jgi:S1-C subfamily serine protease